MDEENQLKVIHSDGTIELFRPRFIKEQLLTETDISEDTALKIQRRVTEKLKKLEINEVSTSTIRAEVSAQLTSRGLLEEEKESRKLGMSVKEFEDLIKYGCKDNANIQYSPELIAKYAYDSIAKEYALLDMPEDCAKAHIDGLIHCLSGNNDLIVKINDDICVMNIVEVIDLYEFQDCYVPSINPLTLKIEWKKIIDGACTGIKPVYELEFAKGYKIECTADHKFLKYNSREQRFNKKYDLRIKDLKENNNIRFGSLNYIPYSNDENYFESAFFGFFLGDGSLNNNKIQFHLVKQDKIDYITWLLDYLDINYKIKEYSTATQIICENKYEFRDKFSMPIFKLNYTGILEGLINSDGYITTHGKLSANYLEFDSTNKFITDLFFVACLTLNIRPSYQIIKRKEKNWSNIYRCIAQNNHVYNLLHDIKLREGHKQRLSKDKSNINIGQTSGLTLKNITELGEQLVYNITVEDNHNFMAGTQGFILTQNCHDLEYFHTRPNCISGNNNIIIKDENDNISYTTIKNFVEEMFLTDKNYYVPSLNIKTNSMEWKKIENAYLSSPLEETYLITFGKGYSIECTSDHKFIKSHNNKPQKQYDIKVSEFDNYKDLRLCNITDLKENNDSNDYNESALFGFFLGDGYISHKGNIKFNFSKKDKAEYLYNLLKQLNIKFTYSEKESNYYDSGYLYSFYIKDKIYPQLSKSELIKKYTSKYNLTGILEGLINSDGHIRLDINNVLRLNFTNTNKNIFDLYQLCLISNGIRGSINITEFDNPNHKDAYNSSSFGEKILSLLSSMNICNRFIPIIKKANPSIKKYNEISELTVKSIEYTGTQAVYNLTIADNHNYLAGINGFVLIQNCMNYDLRFFAKNGLKVDGKGDMGSVAKPAKTLEVLLNHILQAWMAGAVVFSGGQGYVNFNTLLAPFAKGRSYKDIKQAIQGFIFNCNMSLITRGGQVLFSSIGIDLSVPDVLKDEPAIGPDGVVIGTYKDYQNEADMIFRAICEVIDEKDGQGAPHRFPNCLFNIRNGDLDEYSGNCKLLHELGANNPAIYYVNCTSLERSVMGCFSGEEGLWCKIDQKVYFKTFLELSTELNADYGITPVHNIEVLTIDDNKNIVWRRAKNFIKNKKRNLYQVNLKGNKSFICDDTHSMIMPTSLNKKNILELSDGSGVLGLNCNNIYGNFTVDYSAIIYGFWLGDGYKAVDYGCIGVKKEDKIQYLNSIFEKSSISYRTRKTKQGLEFIFNKDFFKSLDLLNKNILAGILSGLISSDGFVEYSTSKRKPSLNIDYKSVSDDISNIFQYCCFMLGIKFSSKKFSQKNENYSDYSRIKISCNRASIHTLKQLILRQKQLEAINLVDENDYREIDTCKSQRIKSIKKLNRVEDTYCFEVNDRIIIGNDFILTGQCRTALPMNFTGDYEIDCINTGNFMYSTINLPLIALEADGDEQKFWNKLGDICEIIYKTLHYRRDCVVDAIYNKHMSDFLLQEDKETGKPLYDIDTTTMTIGFCGLNECLEVLTGKDITQNTLLGTRILAYLNSYKEQFHERDGLRWSVIASPAESTAHRFAEINKEKYPNCPVQGTKDHYYLTNSSHIPVSKGVNLIEHIRNARIYHPDTLGGNILHLWLGEVWTDPKSLWKMNQKIIQEETIFWAYSKVFTYCNECGFTLNDDIDECPICKSKALTTYDRCFSGDTKIFIKKDKIIKPIQLRDFVENYNIKEWKVPVFDSKQQKYIWCPVKRGIKNPIEDMIKVDFNKGYSVTCTPNHNFFKYQMSRRKSMYDTISAKELHIKDKISNHRCPELVTNVSENVLGTFIGFVLGDGTFVNNKDSKNIGIRLTCYKSDKKDYIEWLLKSNNLDYTFRIGSDDRYESTTTYSFYIGASNIGNIAYDMFNKYSNKKDIINECYNEDLMLGVFAGLINSDGSVLLGRKNQIITTFNQVDRKILYLFYWISMLLGVNPSLSFTERKSYKSVGRIEMSSLKMYELLQIIHLREPFNSNVLNGECRSDARNVNGMCSVKSISEAPKQESYCIEVEHLDHNTLFNGVLAQNCTGYYLPTNGFNNGKQQEFKDRYRHAI